MRRFPIHSFEPGNPIAEKDRLALPQGHSARAADRLADAGFKAILVMETRVLPAELRPKVLDHISAADAERNAVIYLEIPPGFIHGIGDLGSLFQRL